MLPRVWLIHGKFNRRTFDGLRCSCMGASFNKHKSYKSYHNRQFPLFLFKKGTLQFTNSFLLFHEQWYIAYLFTNLICFKFNYYTIIFFNENTMNLLTEWTNAILNKFYLGIQSPVTDFNKLNSEGLLGIEKLLQSITLKSNRNFNSPTTRSPQNPIIFLP